VGAKMDTDIGKFLKPTYFCDCDSPLIEEKDSEIAQGYQSQREKAVALFNE